MHANSSLAHSVAYSTLILALLHSAPALALERTNNSLYGERIATQSSAADMDVTITTTADRIQTDVRAASTAIITLIETTAFAELINHKSQIAIRVAKPITHPTTSWHSTNRTRFALGGYCEVLIATSTLIPQEVCVVPLSQVLTISKQLDTPYFLGGFLAAVNSANSIDDVYANALLALQSPVASGLPLIVHNPDPATSRELQFKILQRAPHAEPLSRKLRRMSLAEATSLSANSGPSR